jgi:pimeloyl-ACP methyl ester carboxylesterase
MQFTGGLMAAMESVDFKGRRVAYTATGSGAPMILVHGSLATSATWRKAAANLDGTRCRVLMPDLPGWGESEAPAPDCGNLIEYEAAAIEALARACGEPVHLAGHSHGANIALVAALQGRIAVRSLTLFEPVFCTLLSLTDPEAFDSTLQFYSAYRRDFEGGDRLAVRKVIDLWGGTGAFAAMSEIAKQAIAAWTPLNLRHWQDGFAYVPAPEALRNLRVPTLLVQSERAHPVAKLVVQRLNELIPGSRVVQMAGATHFMVITHPAETAAILATLR